MEFENLKKLSIELADNILFLENSLRDTSSMLFSEDGNGDGIKLFQDLSQQWKKVCDDLEDANKKDEAEVQEICQEYEATEIYFHNIEEKHKEYENVLIEKSLLVPEPQNDSTLDRLGSLEMFDNCGTPISNTFLTSHIPQTTVHSTPDLNGENIVYLEDTMAEFQTR